MNRGDSLDLVVEQLGVDLEVALLSPSGQELLLIDSPNSREGPEPVFWLAQEDGPHLLRLKAAPGAGQGSYRLVFGVPKPATAEDRAKARMFQRYLEAEKGKQTPAEATDLYAPQPDFWQNNGEPLLAARTLRRLGNLAAGRGEVVQARSFFDRALPLYRRHDPGWERITQLLASGNLLRLVAQPTAARSLFEEALTLATSLGDLRGQASALNDLGVLEDFVGNPEAAFVNYRLAREHWHALNDQISEAATLHNLGVLYSRLGRSEDAAAHLQRALAVRRRLASREFQAATASNLARVLSQRGEFEEARALMEQTLNQHQGAPRDRAILLLSLGQLHLETNDSNAARRAFTQALALTGGEADLLRAAVLHRLGQAEAASPGASLDNLNKALAHYQRALELFTPAESPHNRAEVLTSLAQVRRRLGLLDQARQDLTEALALVESGRQRLSSGALRSSYFAGQISLLDSLVSLLVDLDSDEPGQGYAARALEISEQGKGRSLLDGVAGVDWRQRLPTDLQHRERELREILHSRESIEMELLAEGNVAAAKLEAVKRRQTLEDYRHLEAEIVHSLGVEIHPEPLKAARMQALLDEGTTLLQIHWGASEVILFEVRRKDITAHRLARGIEQQRHLTQLTETLRTLLPKSHERGKPLATSVAARALADALLSPIAPRLHNQRLVFIPDGPLIALPLTALPQPGPALGGPLPPSTRKRPYLLEHHEIVQVPSASILSALIKRPACSSQREIALLFDPVFQPMDPRILSRSGQQPGFPTLLRSPIFDFDLNSLGRIPYSRKEARRILDFFPPDTPHFVASGFEANRDTVMSGSLGSARRIHLAVHGLLDHRRPELSGLVFSLYNPQGERQEGFLRPRDIATLDLCADLVVLSACRSALGTEELGEGLTGLTHAFFLAGARRLVASYWDVNDKATADLMVRFYKAHIELQMSPAAALRQAQLEMMRETQWVAPSYWGAFALQGDWY